MRKLRTSSNCLWTGGIASVPATCADRLSRVCAGRRVRERLSTRRQWLEKDVSGLELVDNVEAAALVLYDVICLIIVEPGGKCESGAYRDFQTYRCTAHTSDRRLAQAYVCSYFCRPNTCTLHHSMPGYTNMSLLTNMCMAPVCTCV
jgi:hypothetical protein